MTAGRLRLRGLVKRYGDDAAAVDGLSLDIEAGEFFSLLGPSGCGKTTTLRLVAGFEHPHEGSIDLDGTDLVVIPPHKRPVNTVFQSYALFPFLSVADNVGFGLRYRDVDKSETKRRVAEALELVQMESYASRRPHQLSGGQQQRVALARALVLRPTVLLLDEPLGALDAKLRKQLQLELRQLQREVGITFVYVTHDQEEALTMSDRLAVLAAGRVEQVGAPHQVYGEPATAYVASFLGSANLLEVQVRSVGDGLAHCALTGVDLRARCNGQASPGPGQVVVRPERVHLSPVGSTPPDAGTDANCYRGLVSQLVFVGPATQASVEVDDVTLTALVPHADGAVPAWLRAGAEVDVVIAVAGARLLDRSPAPARDPRVTR